MEKWRGIGIPRGMIGMERGERRESDRDMTGHMRTDDERVGGEGRRDGTEKGRGIDIPRGTIGGTSREASGYDGACADG